MAIYDSVAVFGGVYFRLSDVRPSLRSSTLKSTIGKTFIEKNIPLRDKRDIVLNITGVITGLSRTGAQTDTVAIENDRTALLVLQDGTYHAYSDGRHAGNFVIFPDTLIFEDNADHVDGQPYKFNMQVIEWAGT